MVTKDIFKDVLNDQEIAVIQGFLDNPLLKEAVRKVLLFQLQSVGTFEAGKPTNTANFALSLCAGETDDEALGRKLRTAYEGIKIVETAFADLESLRIIKEEKKSTKNSAR
jgi:hypothetical protein